MNKIDVLDKGYVRLVDHFGSDLKVVNAARASFNKESTLWSEKDEKLLNFLWREKHLSVFRHCALTFEIKAPFMVKNQWIKYQVASTHLEDQNGWNEMSRRYVTEDMEFYVPHFRSAPDNKKQGSAEPLARFDTQEEFDEHLNNVALNTEGSLRNRGSSVADEARAHSNLWEESLQDYVDTGLELFEDAVRAGIAPEQARLFLPQFGMYTKWYWTVSLAALMHFLEERLEHDAQFEIREYAQAVKDLSIEVFPKSLALI